MPEDKTGIRELVYLCRLQQQALPLVTGRVGFLADKGHVFRGRGDYCPFQCHFCAEQRVLDGLKPTPPENDAE